MAKAGKAKPKRSIFWWIGATPIIAIRWGLRILAIAIIVMLLWIALYVFVNPPTTAYIIKEGMRVGGIQREWRDYENI